MDPNDIPADATICGYCPQCKHPFYRLAGHVAAVPNEPASCGCGWNGFSHGLLPDPPSKELRLDDLMAKMQHLRREATKTYSEGGHLIMLVVPTPSEDNPHRARVFVGHSMPKDQALKILRDALEQLEAES